MWLNCNDLLIAMDKVCYVQFADEGTPSAHVFFAGRRQPLIIEAESIEDLIAYFHQYTIEGKNDPPERSPTKG